MNTYAVPYKTQIERRAILSVLHQNGYEKTYINEDGFILVFKREKKYSQYNWPVNHSVKTLAEFLKDFTPYTIDNIKENIWYTCDQGLCCKTDFDECILYDKKGLFLLFKTKDRITNIRPATFEQVEVFFKRNIEVENE